MRDDYKLQGNLKELKVKVESSVAEDLERIAEHTNLSLAELANTALKRFIAGHKDFFPPNTARKTW